ncbi:DUF3857 and transglutaminase domain-containing protein [Aquabacter sp. CN5-332]|uniref:DUF3857 domain-containing transglutaminase family protein n=1 Tax=Aquabacter sp. CN5-332 TaxID=3156608 RepID=UPI0032B46B32
MLVVCALAATTDGRADIPAGLNRFQRSEYIVAQDKTFVEVQTLENRVGGAGDMAPLSKASFTFDPSDETLIVLEAWVLHPDGTKVEVPANHIFTRPSAAAQASPGFVGTQTTTIEFPALQNGSIVHTKFKHTAIEPDVFGFNVAFRLGLASKSRVEIQIQSPVSLPLHFGERGGFTTTDTSAAGTRTIEAAIEVGRAAHAEPQMVSPDDVGPAFIATTLAGPEEIGAIYAARSAGKATATPEIVTLARSIVGEAQGKEAARAVYDWVAEHIRYVAVFLDPSDGFVPHDAATVLRNGYGDCKDHVVLMQALLGAVGIRAEPALVHWSNSMVPLPLWSAASTNHAIVYLPDFDLYANPTSPFAGFGVLDSMLADKPVIIASAKGELRRTPALTAASNTYRSTSTIDVQADGTVRGTVEILISPGLDPLVRQVLESGPASEVARANLMPTQEGGFGDWKSTNPRELSRPLRIDGKWTSPHGVAISSPSTYMTVPLGIDLRPNGALRMYLTEAGTRKFPFIVGPRDYQSTYHLALPNGAVIERLPPALDIRNSAGHVSAYYEATANGFTAMRRVVLDGNVYAPEQYPDLEQLIYGFVADQRATIVFRPAP